MPQIESYTRYRYNFVIRGNSWGNRDCIHEFTKYSSVQMTLPVLASLVKPNSGDFESVESWGVTEVTETYRDIKYLDQD